MWGASKKRERVELAETPDEAVDDEVEVAAAAVPARRAASDDEDEDEDEDDKMSVDDDDGDQGDDERAPVVSVWERARKTIPPCAAGERSLRGSGPAVA